MHILLTTEKGTEEISVVPGSTVLSVLQDRLIPFIAPCGGRGVCGRCRVLITDARGTRYRRACQTEVAEGMEVVIKRISGVSSQVGGCTTPRLSRLLRSYPPDRGVSGLGVAVDVGTTTLLVRLHDLRSGACLACASCLNPQTRFGTDVMSRISAASSGHLDEMREALVAALWRLVERVCVDVHVTHDDLRAFSVVGNSVMEHIAAGLSPESLGIAPFEPACSFGDEHELLPGMPDAWYAPLLGGQVGGDVAAGLLATGLLDAASPGMLVDVGTNGEVALATPEGVCCCSTAAGPAFEGSGILYGMPALPGAISQVTLDHGDIALRTVGDIVPHGICGTGLVDALMVMLELGVMDGEGRLKPAPELPQALQERLGKREGVDVFYLAPEQGIYLSQKDIRSLQLSKGAIQAGVSSLLEHCGLAAGDVSQVSVSGDFGTHLSARSIEAIRLLPRELARKAEFVGNTAIEGASCALLSNRARHDLQEGAARCTSLQLATLPSFQSAFMEGLSF